MGLRRRLDDFDRRLGLYPAAQSDRHAVRWWRVCLLAALVLLVVGVGLYIFGLPTTANLFMSVPIICAAIVLQGWSISRRTHRRNDGAERSRPAQ